MTQQFAVYRNARGRESYPYLLVVQHPLLGHLASRVVVPFMALRKFGTAVSRLNPVFVLEDEEMVLVTHLIGSVPSSSLSRRVADLSARRSDIIAAIDVLFSGV